MNVAEIVPWLLCAWLIGIATAIAARAITCRALRHYQRRMQADTIDAVRRIAAQGHTHLHLTPMQTRRMLRDIEKRHTA